MSSLKPYSIHKRNINGREYQITAFPARKGMLYMARLAKLLSELLRFLPEGNSGGASINSFLNQTVNAKTLDSLVDAIKNSLDDSVVDLIFDLLSYTAYDGQFLSDEDFFNLLFAERYEDVFLLVKEVISINFLSQTFMKKFIKPIENKKEKIKDGSKS